MMQMVFLIVSTYVAISAAANVFVTTHMLGAALKRFAAERKMLPETTISYIDATIYPGWLKFKKLRFVVPLFILTVMLTNILALSLTFVVELSGGFALMMGIINTFLLHLLYITRKARIQYQNLLGEVIATIPPSQQDKK